MPSTEKNKVLIIFSHFNIKNTVSEYVKHYLNYFINLKLSIQLCVVSTSPIAYCDRSEILKNNVDLIIRENIGYDFFSYKIGLDSYDLNKFDGVILCNDSVFGPLYDFQEYIYESLFQTESISGLTMSYEKVEHLQSYFLIFPKNVIINDCFLKFWSEVEILQYKKDIIEKYEIGFSQKMIQSGLKLRAKMVLKLNMLNLLVKSNYKIEFIKTLFYFVFKRQGVKTNPLYFHWKYLIQKNKFPFVKKEIINKEYSIKGEWNQSFHDCKYPIELVQRYLEE